MISYVIALVAAVLLWRIWLGGLGSLGTFLGLVSAGIAVAMQDTIANIAARAYILWLKPFQEGDRIEIDDTRGDVIHAGLFHFSLIEVGKWVDADQSTGRIVTVPNNRVLKRPLFNYTSGFKFVWHEIPITITFESNWKMAKKILERVAHDVVGDVARDAEDQIRRSKRKYMIVYNKLTPAVFTSVAASGVRFTLRYLTDPRRRRGTEEQLWERILTEFGKRDDVDFAYPTQRFYDNQAEGKPEAGGTVRKSVVPRLLEQGGDEGLGGKTAPMRAPSTSSPRGPSGS
jgi:small-conductance mechanosensitive channel